MRLVSVRRVRASRGQVMWGVAGKVMYGALSLGKVRRGSVRFVLAWFGRRG